MSEYQWKLTIVERNLLLSNWMKLIPDAQEQMLEEADKLMGDLPLPDKLRLLASLEKLQYHAEAQLQPKIQKVLQTFKLEHLYNSTKHFSQRCIDSKLEQLTPVESAC